MSMTLGPLEPLPHQQLSPWTFRQQSGNWIAHLQNRRRRPAKPATLARYEAYLSKWILPQLGEKEIGTFRVAAMREFISHLDKAGLSNKTQVEIANAVKRIIASCASDDGEILFPRVWDNERIDLPIVRGSEQHTPTVSAQQIENAIANSDEVYRAFYGTLAGTGLRIGEILAIHIGDDGEHTCWNLNTESIQVRRSLWRGKDQTPKTNSAIRTVEVPSNLALMLAKFVGNRRGFLFGNGAPLSESSARAHSARLGLPGFHAFRRFRTTTLRRARCPEDIIRFWLGHSAGSLTDKYSKLGCDFEIRREWVERVGLGFNLGDG